MTVKWLFICLWHDITKLYSGLLLKITNELAKLMTFSAVIMLLMLKKASYNLYNNVWLLNKKKKHICFYCW